MNGELGKIDIACGLHAILGKVAGIQPSGSQPSIRGWSLGIPGVPTCGDRTLPNPSRSGKVPILDFTMVNLRRRQGIR